MKRFLDLILNPYSLSLWVLLIIQALIPIRIDKYVATLTGQGEYLNNQRIIYTDLDGDHTSEIVTFFHNGMGVAAFTVANKHGILDQWTLKGRFDFATNSGILLFGDYDKNGIKEIYAFTIFKDSVFLFVIPDFSVKDTIIRNHFVSTVGRRNNMYDPYIIEAEMDDLDGDGMKELIFGIGTGYSRYPRRIISYNVVRNSFHMSPPTGYFIRTIIQEDINRDGFNEIIPGGYAAGNISDTSIAFPDTSSWLMVLNRDLLFEFEPIRFSGIFSNLKPVVISGSDGNLLITALYSPPENSGLPDLFYSFNEKGEIIGIRKLDNNRREANVIMDKNGLRKLIVGTKGEGISVYDQTFENTGSISYDYDGGLYCNDIDLDGLQEIINVDLLARKVIIFRNQLKYPVSLHINGLDEKGLLYSTIEEEGKIKGIYFQLGLNFNIYTYGRNPMYRYRWLIFAAIYMSVLIFILIVRKIQRDQIRRKNETTRKITDLQLQIVRNQLDPHFIMNAVNSIIAGMSENEKEDVKKQLIHFSQMHRSLILTSDQIKRSLHEEIEFTRNYLALEKFRFRDKFSYEFDIDKGVDMNWEVPKMIVQIYVENALKHGIFHRENNGGIVLTKVSGDDNRILIEITDNGVGREFTRARESFSTGKGTQLMQQYSDLINKTFTDKIIILTEDLYKENGDSAGTKVTIEITF